MTALAPDPTTDRPLPRAGGFSAGVVRLELRRLLRNRRTVVFTLVMPFALFLFVGTNASYVHQRAGHGNVTAYIMISMAVYGAALATTSGGATVAVERALGWSRQLRLTPLSPVAYVAMKIIVSLVLGLASVVVVYAVGAATGKPDMPVHAWVLTALVAWLGSMVFAAFGLFMGYLLPSENVMQVLGPVMALLAFAGGLFMPLEDGSLVATLAQLTPMYGLAELARSPLTGDTVQLTWVANVVVWLAVFTAGAVWRMRRDTARV